MNAKPTSICIIDDEAAARENVKMLLAACCPHTQIIGEADGVVSGLKLLRQHRPAIVFLDVEMQDGTGFDLLNRLEFSNFALIFLTAHPDFALRAFKYSAIDYLLKPLDADELQTAVEKAVKYISQQVSESHPSEVLSEALNRRILLKTSESIHIVPVDEIIRLEASCNYTTFYLTEKRKILISKTLKEQEKLLENYGFFRVHQSHLINLRHITRIDRNEGNTLIMTDQVQVPVSLRKKDQLLQVLKI